jgi:hypothetical protein
MNHPLFVPTRRTFFGGIAILALILGGILAWRHFRTQAPAAELTAFLERTAGAGRLRFSAVEIRTLRQDEGGLQLSVAATARTLQPLYSKIDATDYLRQKFQLDPESVADARRLLAERGSPRNSEIMGAGPVPADPYEAAILELRCPAGTQFGFRGVVDAHRDDAGWYFSLSSGGLEGGGPQGEARSGFGDPSFVAGNGDDDARLRALAAGLQAFAAHVAEGRKSSESSRAAAIEGRRKAFLAQVAPGRMFRGLAVEAEANRETPLYLEIASVSPENEVTAFLRNEGGWHNARVFQGSWSTDDGFENPVLSLISSPDQAVANAGPFLENTQKWSFALHMDPRGALSERDSHYQYQFQPLRPEEVSALKAALEAEFARAMTATSPGLLYDGTAASRTAGTSEPVLLRFTGRSPDGKSVEAVLESTVRSWKRVLHGTIIDNSRRTGGEPLRLQTGANEATEDAPAGSVFGNRDDLQIRLGIKDGLLAGEDGRFAYRLSVANDAFLQQLEATRAERARRFMGAIRAGIAYDGILRESQGIMTQVRLEITGIDPQTGAITASICTLAQFGIHRDLFGTFDASGGAVVFGSRGRGELDAIVNPNIPFLKAPNTPTLRLTFTGISIAGPIEGYPHSRIEFPTGTFLSAPTESSEPNSPPADGSVFPPFPKNGGAYLLSRGAWASMPKNAGRIVLEKVKSSSELRLPINVAEIDMEEEGGPARTEHKGKVPYLEFDGKVPRPKSNGPAIIVLFIGPAPADIPPVELAPAETLPDGRRRVELMGDAPTMIRFGEQRLAAYVRQIAPNAMLFTTTSPLPPGPYVFKADAGYELTQE